MATPMTSFVKSAANLIPARLRREVKQRLDERAVRARAGAARAQLAREAAALSAACLSGIATRADWDRRRPEVRRQLLDMLGLEPLPERTPLRARITGGWERDAYRVEKLVLESRPGLYVTGNFYLPKAASGPVPCVVYLNGHWASLDGAKTGFQDRYLWYPAHGFALLVLDPVGYGEVPGVHPGTNRLEQWHWLSLGYTPAGVEVWNAMRALDWLETRPEIDRTKIGATGISGGGVITQFWTALDERVAVAAPSCSTYTIGSQVAGGLIPQQCDCTFYPNVFGVDFPEVLALIAPRPLLILGGRRDSIFPPEGFRAAYQRARKVYGLCGADAADSRIRLVESGKGHADPPEFLQATRQWMARWLRGGELPAAETAAAGPERESPEVLRCLPSAPPDAINHLIQDRWICRPERPVPASRNEWERRQTEILGKLRTTVFGWLPRAEIPFRTRAFSASGGYAGEMAAFREYQFDSEAGVPVKACLLTPKGKTGALPLVIWVRSPAEPVIFPDLDEFFPVLRTHALAILWPRFTERPLTRHEHANLERSAALTGRSLAALRVWDILRTAAWATSDRGLTASRIAVYGHGEESVAGLYAALLEPAIGHVILRDPPVSHFEGPALPLVLRIGDLDEIAGTLAPRRLTMVARRSDGYERTRALYALHGVPWAFQRAASVADALRESAKGKSGC